MGGTDGTTRAVALDGDALVDLGATDVGAFLALPDWSDRVAAAIGDDDATRYDAATADWRDAALVPAPSKVVCVGLDYSIDIQEMGRDLPQYPTLFCKFADILIGAGDDIAGRPETEEFDWEVELAVVIGTSVRRAERPAGRGDAIAGFTVFNDITCRDWQFRTREWLQGKNWDSTTSVGPGLVHPRTARRRTTGLWPCGCLVDGRSCSPTPPPTCCSTRSFWSSTSPRWCGSILVTSLRPGRPAGWATPAPRGIWSAASRRR